MAIFVYVLCMNQMTELEIVYVTDVILIPSFAISS
jgi:hypothetical protein